MVVLPSDSSVFILYNIYDLNAKLYCLKANLGMKSEHMHGQTSDTVSILTRVLSDHLPVAIILL